MNLHELLNKTQDKLLKTKSTRLPVSVATEERPYYDNKKTDNKPITNQQQTDNKPITNQQQTDNKVVTNQQQSDNKAITKSLTNRQQTGNKKPPLCSFSLLTGLERGLTLYIYRQYKLSGFKITPPLTLETISIQHNTSKGSVKMTLYRLEAKGVIVRARYKNGRGGWTQYQLTETMCQEIIQLENQEKLLTNWQQTDNKAVTEPITSPSSSSSYNNLITTTTGTEVQKVENELSERIDISPLEEFGFTENHLKQIVQKTKLEFEAIQFSINAFAFDLKKNNKIKELKKSPIHYFMGILCKNMPYAPPPNYESPEEEAIRVFNERERAYQEKRKRLEEDAQNLGFIKWRESISVDEVKELGQQLIPSGMPRGCYEPGRGAFEAMLKGYYVKHLWPEEKKKILNTEAS